jgi:hypothetical protein
MNITNHATTIRHHRLLKTDHGGLGRRCCGSDRGAETPVDSKEGVDLSEAAKAERAALAESLLARAKSGRLELLSRNISGVVDGADALSNIRDTAHGRPAKRSSYEGAPGGSVNLSIPMLRTLSLLAAEFSYAVTSIAGGSHSRGSLHYLGVAFDVDTINGQRVSANHPRFRYFMQRARELGATEIYGPGDRGHSGHLHVAFPLGSR